MNKFSSLTSIEYARREKSKFLSTSTVKPCSHCGGGVSAQLDAGGVNSPCHGYTGGVNEHEKDVLASPVVAIACWGYYYQTNPAVPAEFAAFITQLFGSTYWSNLKEYGINQGTLAGVSVCNGDIFDNTGGPQAQLQSWLSQGLLPQPLTPSDAKNWVYLILPPPGEVVHSGSVSSLTGLCGYHGHQVFQFAINFGDTSHDPTWIGDFTGVGHSQVLFYSPGDGHWWLATYNTGKGQFDWTLRSVTRGFSADVPFAIVAMPSNPASGAKAVVNSVSYCISHELTEAFTNPRGKGFYSDANGCEVGDLCEQLGTFTVAGWNVEKYWSNKNKGCVS